MNPTTPENGAVAVAPTAPAAAISETGTDPWIVGAVMLLLFVAIVACAVKRRR